MKDNSVKRLTKKTTAGKYVPIFRGVTHSPKDFYECVDRLGAIEDILGDTYDLDCLRELIKAKIGSEDNK